MKVSVGSGISGTILTFIAENAEDWRTLANLRWDEKYGKIIELREKTCVGDAAGNISLLSYDVVRIIPRDDE